MAFWKKLTAYVGWNSVHEAAGSGRRSRVWNPGDPGAVSAMLATGNQLRVKSRDLVRRNAWAANAVDSFVSNAIGTGIKPQSLVDAFIDKRRDDSLDAVAKDVKDLL